eukprot:TRINITY_DN4692_c0_g1_i1.p1 TRINITY_DN4692_c0_g1~~TRINITY_DN4692_c0_g1_i1.p1  ORF type:complete len:169 (+),score=47.21 TRINITY_DN4692_c0_g1_i1:77-583(+)
MSDEKASERAPLDEFTKIVELAIGTVDKKNLGSDSVQGIITWMYDNGYGRLTNTASLSASDLQSLANVDAAVLNRIVARLRMMEPYFFSDWVVGVAGGFFKDFASAIVNDQTASWSVRYARSLSVDELRPHFDESRIFADFPSILHRALHPDIEGKQTELLLLDIAWP